METVYKFAIYKTPEKYNTFSVRGEKKYNMMRSMLRKYDYWFTVSYTSPYTSPQISFNK